MYGEIDSTMHYGGSLLSSAAIISYFRHASLTIFYFLYGNGSRYIFYNIFIVSIIIVCYSGKTFYAFS